MKDSGVKWIGIIPENWKIIRIKDEYYFETGFTPSTSNSEYYLDENGYEWATISDLKDGKVICPTSSLISQNYVKETYRKVYPSGCLFYSFKLSVGQVAITDRQLFANEAIACFFPTNDICIEFLKYSSSLIEYSANINIYGAPILNRQLIKNAYIVFPPVYEQNLIASYLDHKCTEIGSIISDIQKQIETLEEYKQSVITEAVTKGLDRNVPMKDSGISWIGDIPEHWDTVKIGRIFHLRNERNYKTLDEVQLLSLYTDIGIFPHGEQEERGNKAVTAEGYKIVKKNDIVVNIILAWMGAIGISNYEGVTSPAYDVYMPDLKKVVPHFFHYVLRTKGIAGECFKYGKGIMLMRWRTYSSEFKLISVPYPNIKEQQKIADYLDHKCAEIDSLISEKKKQIETLEEYKKSLIFEYVTGKREVNKDVKETNE